MNHRIEPEDSTLLSLAELDKLDVVYEGISVQALFRNFYSSRSLTPMELGSESLFLPSSVVSAGSGALPGKKKWMLEAVLATGLFSGERKFSGKIELKDALARGEYVLALLTFDYLPGDKRCLLAKVRDGKVVLWRNFTGHPGDQASADIGYFHFTFYERPEAAFVRVFERETNGNRFLELDEETLELSLSRQDSGSTFIIAGNKRLSRVTPCGETVLQRGIPSIARDSYSGSFLSSSLKALPDEKVVCWSQDYERSKVSLFDVDLQLLAEVFLAPFCSFFPLPLEESALLVKDTKKKKDYFYKITFL